MDDRLNLLEGRFTQRYGPEWGSGGIFGLKYHRGVLYFTLAFEGEAHFINLAEERERTYGFNLVGPAPTSGGDTYNAVAAVDGRVYFGGWVHAPAVYLPRDRRISFVNKYSHVHVYDVEEDEVRLLWKDSIHHETEWAGEVSEILYDPYNDRLLLAREDGHEHLGVYSLDVEGGKAESLLDRPSLKGTMVHDLAFFGVGKNFVGGLEAFASLDLITGKWDHHELGESVDGMPVRFPQLGSMASAYNRVMAFVRGGMFIGNPAFGEEFRFVRLFDFPSLYGPLRANALNVGGGVLAAFNTLHDDPRGKAVGPSVLIYVVPPLIKVVGVFGARITSMESMPGRLLVAANTTPNAGAAEATPFDTGVRDLMVLDEGVLQDSPPTLRFSFPLHDASSKGSMIFGGIPISGYRRARLLLSLKKDNELTVHEYDTNTLIGTETYEVKEGRNVIDLDSFSGIVSFRLEEQDNGGWGVVDLS